MTNFFTYSAVNLLGRKKKKDFLDELRVPHHIVVFFILKRVDREHFPEYL